MSRYVAGVLMCLSLPLFGQSPVDSLRRALLEATKIETRTEILLEISNEAFDEDIHEAYQTADSAYQLSLKSRNLLHRRRALTYKAFYFYLAGDQAKAKSLYRESSALAKKMDEWDAYNAILFSNLYTIQARYDSAESLIKTTLDWMAQNNSTTYQALAYKYLGNLYMTQWRNEEALVAFGRAVSSYKKSGRRIGLNDAYLYLSKLMQNVGDHSKAWTYVDSACNTERSTPNFFLDLRCAIQRGDLLRAKGEYTAALQIMLAAVDSKENRNDLKLYVDLYTCIGDVYEEMGQNELALRYYFEGLNLAQLLHAPALEARLLSSIAWVYKNQLNFGLAYEHCFRSLSIRERIGDQLGISNSYNSLGMLKFLEKKYPEAETYLNNALAIRKKLKYREGISASLYNLALVYEETGKLDKAIGFHRTALQTDMEMNNQFGMGISYNTMGSLYTKLKQYDSAQFFLEQSARIGTALKSRLLLMNNRKYLADLFEATGDFKRSLDAMKEYVVLHDSIYSRQSAEKIGEVQALYQIQQKEQEIRALNQQTQYKENQIQLQESAIRFQRTVIVSLISFFFLLSFIAYNNYRYNGKIKKANREITEQKEEIMAQSEELMEANHMIAEINRKLEAKVEDRTSQLRQAYKELDTFFYRSSHDFRRPLTTFLGLAEVAKITVRDDAALELFSKVRETAHNLDKMLIKLQSISIFGSQHMVYNEVFIPELFDEVLASLREDINSRSISIQKEINIQSSFYSYPAMIRIIVENLVENAVFFSGPVDPYIKISATKQQDLITIKVEDNGEGIQEEYASHIFEMYFRGNERSKGNGLGLYIVKKVVEKLEGDIEFTSVYAKGSVFTVTLPCKKNSSQIPV